VECTVAWDARFLPTLIDMDGMSTEREIPKGYEGNIGRLPIANSVSIYPCGGREALKISSHHDHGAKEAFYETILYSFISCPDPNNKSHASTNEI
jgi:hypothetical protein